MHHIALIRHPGLSYTAGIAPVCHAPYRRFLTNVPQAAVRSLIGFSTELGPRPLRLSGNNPVPFAKSERHKSRLRGHPRQRRGSACKREVRAPSGAKPSRDLGWVHSGHRRSPSAVRRDYRAAHGNAVGNYQERGKRLQARHRLHLPPAILSRSHE